ncbi:MAG TPA: SRPBCC domain-containing protein, partial [Tabrizicola sp.]|nr:SRPBCC domain-containing protein [Tabrizicola sp.]
MPDTLPAATDSDLVYSRDFNASPALLWRAITDPAVLPLWLGGDTNPMIQCDSDLRPGGAFRWVWRHDGQPTGVTGRFLAVDAPRRLVNTELFDQDWTMGETTVTQTLTELAPQTTRLRMTIRYTSPAARDAAGPTMMAGLTAHYATLDRLLPTLIPGRSDFHLLATGDR